MAQKKNIFYKLRSREYHSPCHSRVCLSVMKTLICDKDAHFKKIWEKHSNFPITYECGRIYMDNHRTCFSSYGIGGPPQKLYKLPPCCKTQKIEDTLLCQCPLNTLPRKHQGFRPCMLALTADNWLQRYDVDSGELLQQCYLSSRHKFRHLAWDCDLYTLTIRSTHTKMSALHRQAGIVQNMLMVITVMTVFPLEFQAQIEITKEVFGHDITDSMLAQGVLITMHQGGMVKTYSWQHVLEQGLQFTAKLGEEHGNGVVGEHPYGLPVNVRLKEAPPVLFSVRCSQHNLTLGGIPWHYIISPHGYNASFHVYSVKEKKLAENGQLDMATVSVEPDKCLFHADDSGRILHIGANELRVHRIVECDNKPSEYRIVPEFVINAAQLKQKPKENTCSEVIITSSGRTVKRTISHDDELIDCSYESMQTVDYENELDVLSVTAVHQEEEGFAGTVYLCDNHTGQLLKKIPLPEPWKEFYEHVVILDVDTVIHLVKGPMRRFSCYVHRLDRTESASAGCSQSKRPRTRCPVSELQRPPPRSSARLQVP